MDVNEFDTIAGYHILLLCSWHVADVSIITTTCQSFSTFAKQIDYLGRNSLIAKTIATTSHQW